MKLFQITIKNFRKFKKATIPLTKSHLILGANDSGKSTIMKAIDIALFDLPVDKKDIIDDGEGVSITLNFYDEEREKLVSKIYTSKSTKSNTKFEMFPKEFKNENLIRHIFIPSELIKAEETALNVVINNNDNIRDLIIQLKKQLEEGIHKLLNKDENDISLVIGSNTKFKSSVTIKPSAKIEVEKDLPLSQKGEGYQKNISLSLLKKIKPSTSLILIDEIENHFSIPNVKKIISSIAKKNQVIFTSHRLEGEIGDIKGITFLGEDEIDISGAIDALKIEVSQYEKIILVEGKTDIYYINKFIEIQRKKSIKFSAIVVAVNGESKMKKVGNKLNEIGIEKNKIILIKDGDQRYKKEENVHYLKKDKIEDYRDDVDSLEEEYKDHWKDAASMKLDFMDNEENELIKELTTLFFNKK